MYCREGERLLRECSYATSVRAVAAIKLSQSAGEAPHPNSGFNLALERFEEARIISEHAHAVYTLHRQEHSC